MAYGIIKYPWKYSYQLFTHYVFNLKLFLGDNCNWQLYTTTAVIEREIDR